MPERAKRTFSLSAEEASFVDTLVASGAYTSRSEVVRAGLQALRERTSSVERWLQQQVVPVYDAMRSDPGRAVSASEVAAAIRARHAERVTRKRGA